MTSTVGVRVQWTQQFFESLTRVCWMLKQAGGVPAYGNQRSEWDAGCRLDFENLEHR